jgi:glyoxylase-like metal-dependent hydrolase (beta-lactamase superfamily II)
VDVEELKPGLWRWTADHPEWSEEEGGEEGWQPEVSSFAVHEPDELVLVDPLVPDDEAERFWRALDDDVGRHGTPAVVLTVFWHTRSAQAILDRYEGAEVWAPAAAEDRARERVPVMHLYGDGDRLPAGIEGKTTEHRAEALLWLAKHHALIAGDILLGTAGGGVRVCPDSWLRPGVTGEMVREGLRPLLDLPVELILLAHGTPITEGAHAALAEALER